MHTVIFLFVQLLYLSHNTSFYTSHMRSSGYQRFYYSCAESAFVRLTLLAL